MNKENTKRLFERFEFFHPKKSLNESLMTFGFDCDDGWFNILWKLCEQIEKELENNNDEEYPFEVIQVKEKFGGHRFYTNWETDRITSLISKAERKSYKTCEVCGKRSQLMTKGHWLKTVCSKHAKELGFYSFKEFDRKHKEK